MYILHVVTKTTPFHSKVVLVSPFHSKVVPCLHFYTKVVLCLEICKVHRFGMFLVVLVFHIDNIYIIKTSKEFNCYV